MKAPVNCQEIEEKKTLKSQLKKRERERKFCIYVKKITNKSATTTTITK